jgi:cytidine deaminase
MREKLIKLLDNSYSPYSNFKVAAILVTKDGQEFNGVNVENASYGASICAERSAIVSAISNGYKKYDFEKLYIMVSGNKLSTCCFLCRQVISELFEKDKEIILMNKDGETLKYTVEELCPYPFDEGDLK